MKRSFARTWRMTAIMLGVALVTIIGRTLWVNGLFSSVKPGFSGTCKVAGDLPGVQDIEIAGGMAFLSVSSARGPDAADGIYAMALNGTAKPVKLAGGPKDFHPRGIGLSRTPDGKGVFLLAVNHHSGASAGAGATNDKGRFSIDSFEVTDPQTNPALVAQGTIEGGQLINPQDVAAAGVGSFYVANGTASKNPLIHGLQAYGLISGGNVLYFNGNIFRVAVDGLYGTRSLVMMPGGTHLIVGGLLSRTLTAFSREPFNGQLTEVGNITLPAGPEKISIDAQGALWVAGHADLFQWRDFVKNPARGSSSQIFRVSLLNGVPQDATQVYGNDGAQLAGASVAAAVGPRLLMGSSLDKRLLDCKQ
jgi:hypothetical protein